MEAEKTTPVFHIEVEKIKPNPHQPRRNFDEESLKELAASIREFGILQPLIVSKTEIETETGTGVLYELIAGERRLLAAKMLGLERVPAIIKIPRSDFERLEMAIVENIQRENLNPIETARAYAKLQDQFGLTQREIASRLGKSRETISNTLRLLNLSSEIQDAVSGKQISESQARLLLMLDDLGEQRIIFQELLSKNLSVRDLRNRIKKTELASVSELVEVKPVDPEILSLQERLAELLGAQVKIDPPRVIITFYSPEEIEGIIQKIKTDSSEPSPGADD